MYYNGSKAAWRRGAELTDLPNIGPVLADNLHRVEITTPEELRAFFDRAKT
ncbi:hypothetical protein [Dysosmobacter sp.]|uniref:hypothetical protein n=1 Tax=Dysosmobacter sp. TaxID=2591382 RepID=UPI002A9A18D9|nr:hypothetical protein [Dysosmobacter sp.]MDY5613573.1 hypothetical protein [Dysosmobacter sp.]